MKVTMKIHKADLEAELMIQIGKAGADLTKSTEKLQALQDAVIKGPYHQQEVANYEALLKLQQEDVASLNRQLNMIQDSPATTAMVEFEI